MKLVIKHDLPRRLRYAEVYLQLANASAFVTINGSSASWFARIGCSNPVQISDKEYSRIRASLPVESVLDDDGEAVILRNAKGREERWYKPRWILESIRRIKKLS
jgi:hypothetical protein